MREMVWIKTPRIEAWGCSRCSWAFSPTGPPLGSHLSEMMQNYELQRDKEFASHICAARPKSKTARDNSKLPR